MTVNLAVTGTRMTGFMRRNRAELVILIFMNAVYFFSYFHRVGIPGTIFNELQSEFALSGSAMALLGALYMYIYAGMQLIAGVMNDRLGAVRVLLIGGGLLCIGSLVFPLAHTVPMLFGARALIGLGSSLIFLSVVKALGMLFAPQHFAQLLGISMFLGCAGGLAGTFPFERAVSLWGWRGTLLGAGVLCSVLYLGAAFLFRANRQRTRHSVDANGLRLGAVVHNRLSIPLLIAGPLNFGIYFLVQATLGKKILLDYAGMSSALATSFTFILMLVTMTMAVVGGFLTRAFGKRRKPILTVSYALTLLGLGLLLLFIHFGVAGPWFIVGYILLGLSTASATVGNTLMKELNPPEALGTAIGLLNSASYLAVAGLASMAGWVLDCFKGSAIITTKAIIYPKQAYLVVFALCICLSLVAVISSCFIHETRGKSVYQ